MKKLSEKDQNNLDFLLNSPKEVIRNWYETTGFEDHDYAMELLYRKSVELSMRSAALAEDCENELEEEITDFALANKVLAKFTNK